MPPLAVYLLTLFYFRSFSLFGPSGSFSRLIAVRRLAKEHGGIVFSRPDFLTGKREELEHWRDGVVTWRNPRFDAIMKSRQDYLEDVAKFWDLAPYFIDVDDRMP